MKITKSNKLARQSEFASGDKSSPQELFNYLNSLVKTYCAFHKDTLKADFDKVLDEAQDILQASEPSQVPETSDPRSVTDLNIVDFASFLDKVIKITADKNSDSDSIQRLAAKNIFTAHLKLIDADVKLAAASLLSVAQEINPENLSSEEHRAKIGSLEYLFVLSKNHDGGYNFSMKIESEHSKFSRHVPNLKSEDQKSEVNEVTFVNYIRYFLNLSDTNDGT